MQLPLRYERMPLDDGIPFFHAKLPFELMYFFSSDAYIPYDE